jgi:XTP/dITP diphosphohydrolase
VERIAVATANAGKLREIRSILAELPVELLPLSSLPPVRFPEEGDDYARNAREKAGAAARQLGMWAVADDSGLEVEALGGAPGPHSARYGGAGLDDAGRVRLLLAQLEGRPEAERRARFVCAAACATPEGGSWLTWGECRGWIVASPRGSGGFGYDPVFRPEGGVRTLAELPPAAKDELSHRARAFRALAAILRDQLGR